VPDPLTSNFLMPSGTFVVLLVALVAFVLLVIWPLVETVVRQQWGYTFGVVVLGPVGGLLWFLVGRRESARHGRVSTQPV
jgi:dipeptide/tripeptide permease